MADHAPLRKKLLLATFRRSDGDITRLIAIEEMSKDLGWTVDDTGTIAYQLIAKNSLSWGLKPMGNDFTGWKVVMTIRGLEEAERMERHWLRRFHDDHLALAGGIWTIIVLILSVLVNKLADVIIKAMGW